MPFLPLPPDAGVGGGALPVTDDADVLAEFPTPHKSPSSAPVRDSIVGGFTDGFTEYQRRAEYAAAQCDPLRATGDYLRSIAEEKEIYPSAQESDEEIRGRLFTATEIVTPKAIDDAVEALLALATDLNAEIYEPEVDGLFISDGTAIWDSFIGANPRYLDRLYLDDAVENDGDYIPDNRPGGAVPMTGLVRFFVVRVPPLTAVDSDFEFVTTADDGCYIDDGTGSFGSFSYATAETEDEIYAAIVGKVNSIKGQGITWELLVDASL